MSNADAFDLIVLGAGPTGENLADRARAGGLSVAIVERELVGGECSYWACMPSKALLRPPAALQQARRLPGARAAAGGELDTDAVLRRRDAFAAHWQDDGQVAWLDSAGITLVRGHGRLDGERRVAVDLPEGGRRTLTARHAVALCTGTRAALPDLPGIEQAGVWTNREATGAAEAPPRLAIVGGGAVAVELATAWQALGSRVTLLVRGQALLPKLEPFAGELVAEALREAGVDLRFGVSVEGLTRSGELVLDLGEHGELRAEEVLFATGRRPATGELGLETVGLEPGGWIEVDDTGLAVGVPGGWLYAAGDVNRRALLTHQGKYQGRVFGTVIADRAAGRELDLAPWGRSVATADRVAVPQVVFTDPEVASVGLTLAEATASGRRVRAVDYRIGDVAGAALFADGYRGQARALIDLDRETVLGVTFVGAGVAELLHSATVAVAGEVPLDRLWHAVPAYPTVSEVWLRLLETYRG
ncbi:dihydrolipoyl dehydrogenase family protein [Saccharothrix sp. ST-888]|uniref:dihydrolipoyl dehydrogenase family protein n=1 Tax=Saccharothrix sp. ST-888 TaxID=1427391 RepID=UPI0005EC9C14|nr:NAD(P)/FAD-dependent oxidoreductase [Saccharothrix sp. ST-888]KJK59116.1 pyridine nucleotide-disulfide oxidoreductase [Saccharothrix sp. ST-888]